MGQFPFEEKNFLGDRLRAIRMMFQYRQEDVAKALNMSRATYTYYETNGTRPDPITLGKIAAFYDVPIDIFYDEQLTLPTSLNDSKRRRANRTAGLNVERIGELRPEERSLILLLRSNGVFTTEQVIQSLEHQLAVYKNKNKNQEQEK